MKEKLIERIILNTTLIIFTLFTEEYINRFANTGILFKIIVILLIIIIRVLTIRINLTIKVNIGKIINLQTAVIKYLLSVVIIKVIACFTNINVECLLVISLSILITEIFLAGGFDKFIVKNVRKLPPKKLNKSEIKLVEDVKKLIKSVDKSIEIADFIVYNVLYITVDGLFCYNYKKSRLDIFIPFWKIRLRDWKNRKDILFQIILHEVIHSQNEKYDTEIFWDNFNEGITQVLTLWLIENYSKDYKLVESYQPYKKRVENVSKILEESGVDMKEVFLNYIKPNEDFFRTFVPRENFIIDRRLNGV